MPPQKEKKEQQQPNRPKPQQKPVSTADVLRPAQNPQQKPTIYDWLPMYNPAQQVDPSRWAADVPVVSNLTAPDNYSIGATGNLSNGTVGLQWNPAIIAPELRPDLPSIPTPSLLPLDLKRRSAASSGLTDDATNRLYQTQLAVSPYNGEDYLGLYRRIPGQIELKLFGDQAGIDPRETINHEFGHANDYLPRPIPNPIFLNDLQSLAEQGVKPAKSAMDFWNASQDSNYYSPFSKTSELYAEFAGQMKAGEPVPQWFLDKYYSGMYRNK